MQIKAALLQKHKTSRYLHALHFSAPFIANNCLKFLAFEFEGQKRRKYSTSVKSDYFFYIFFIVTRSLFYRFLGAVYKEEVNLRVGGSEERGDSGCWGGGPLPKYTTASMNSAQSAPGQ